MYSLSDFNHKYPFWVNLVQKLKIVSLSLKLVPNLNMQNSMVMFTFSVLERKYHFWANLVLKIKIVSLF